MVRTKVRPRGICVMCTQVVSMMSDGAAVKHWWLGGVCPGWGARVR